MATSMDDGNFENFIKILRENIINIKEMCSKYKNKDAGVAAFAERSLEKLERLEKKLHTQPEIPKITDFGMDQVKECLQLYAQILLDVTFCEENILVDGVFPEKNAALRVHKLLTMLRQPEVICTHCFPDSTSKELLGDEILECLLWRRGALLYMYCHTVQEDAMRLNNERSGFVENCKDGTIYLNQMLCVRQPLKEERDEVDTNDDDMFDLLKKGVFTETHVLSLLYAGELCYWHLKHSKTDTPEKSEEQSSEISEATPKQEESESSKSQSAECKPSEFNAKEIGSQLLRLYRDIVQGPLKNHGWRLERANELLACIENADEVKVPDS